MSSSTHARVAAVVEELKQVVLADPQLREIARQAKTPDQLADLWASPRFREVHDRTIAGINTDDVKSYLSELKDEQLDNVTGGAVDAFMPINFNTLSPRDTYSFALQQSLMKSF